MSAISDKRVFRVEICSVGYVLAASYEDAVRIARRHADEIVSDDSPCPDVSPCPLTSLKQLDSDWDGSCLLYADEVGDFPIRDFLPEHTK